MDPFDAMVAKVRQGVFDEYGPDPVAGLKAFQPESTPSQALTELVDSVARGILPEKPSKAWILRCLVAHPEFSAGKATLSTTGRFCSYAAFVPEALRPRLKKRWATSG